jgi:catechol 2,3-dioxygenase-like lactoylglutathione lyase family enzyme
MSVAIRGNPRDSKQSQRVSTGKETLRGAPNFIGVRHVGLPAKDPAVLALFYRDVMGMKIMRQSPTDAPYGATAFLARHPEEEDHDVVFFSNPTLAHTAFRVASLGDLLAFYRKIKEQGVPIKYSLNHATEFSFYFDDPEGHLIEIYWATNLPIPDNYAEPIDLELSEEELLRKVDRLSAHFGVQASPMPR